MEQPHPSSSNKDTDKIEDPSFFNFSVGNFMLECIHKILKRWMKEHAKVFLDYVNPESTESFKCENRCQTRTISKQNIKRKDQKYNKRYQCSETQCNKWVERVIQLHRGYGREDDIYWNNSPEIPAWRDNAWEIAKLFMNDLKKDSKKKFAGPDDHDLGNLLNLLKHFIPFERDLKIHPKLPDHILQQRNEFAHTKSGKTLRKDLESYIRGGVDLLEALGCSKKDINEIENLKALKPGETVYKNGFLESMSETFKSLYDRKDEVIDLLDIIKEVRDILESVPYDKVKKSDVIQMMEKIMKMVRELEKQNADRLEKELEKSAKDKFVRPYSWYRWYIAMEQMKALKTKIELKISQQNKNVTVASTPAVQECPTCGFETFLKKMVDLDGRLDNLNKIQFDIYGLQNNLSSFKEELVKHDDESDLQLGEILKVIENAMLIQRIIRDRDLAAQDINLCLNEIQGLAQYVIKLYRKLESQYPAIELQREYGNEILNAFKYLADEYEKVDAKEEINRIKRRFHEVLYPLINSLDESGITKQSTEVLIADVEKLIRKLESQKETWKKLEDPIKTILVMTVQIASRIKEVYKAHDDICMNSKDWQVYF